MAPVGDSANGILSWEEMEVTAEAARVTGTLTGGKFQRDFEPQTLHKNFLKRLAISKPSMHKVKL